MTLWLLFIAGMVWAAAGLQAEEAVVPLPPVEQSFFDRIRLAALGDPQDLTEPLLLDDVAPPGQAPQEFEPPAGRKLPREPSRGPCSRPFSPSPNYPASATTASDSRRSKRASRSGCLPPR